MTENEAKEILLQRLSQLADDDYPLVWVGELIEERPDAFVFEADTYREGEDPKAESGYWWVIKSERRCTPPPPGY